jgi:ABC transport system ATP-binding/permease protein
MLPGPMLLTGRNLAKHYGPRLLFSGITLGLAEGERVGLIGVNGSGKSTLLKIFAGQEQPDEGELVARRNLKVGYVEQENNFPPDRDCLSIVADAIDPHLDQHEREVRAQLALDRANFVDSHQLAGKLSGGWRKRLAIVQQLAREPDLLLMDEPTNHLDIEGITWLEDQIDAGDFATLIVSHDRRFLEEVATRVIELGRQYPQGFLSHEGAYSDFVEKREEFLSAQQARQQAVASGVRREIEWLRRGAKARTTKAKGRIERAHDMMAELADLKTRNTRQGAAEVEFAGSNRQTRKLIELKRISKSFGERTLFKDVSIVLAPKDRLGLLGANGSGKSTLIKLLQGAMKPDTGEVVQADALKVVVFDQHREQLDLNITLRRALSPTGDSLSFQGQQIHVTGWAKKFLFRNEQLDLPIRELSGGERARVLIARLMLKEADVLILDEPTNDLDIPTLEVLESSIDEFAGAVVMVTHDRYLLDRMSSRILALGTREGAKEYAALSQWEAAQNAPVVEEKKKTTASDSTRVSTPSKKKLTWNEQKELDGMEAAILKQETIVYELQAQANDPAVISDHAKSRTVYEQLGAAQAKVDQMYARWAELESKGA